MFFVIPYRVKNPAAGFPFATACLIAINVIIYCLTSENLLVIKDHILNRYGFTMGASPVQNILTASFLHAEPTHLLGNMLFLWVFGGPVEDRLKIPRYLLVYLLTGCAGWLLQGALDLAAMGKATPGIGASGCIMGILGAYWYLFPLSTVCLAYFVWFFFRIWYGIWEVAALWVIGFYLIGDLAYGALFGASGIGGGVAYFAHVGGGFTGVLICLLLRPKRDTEAISEAKAIQADLKDITLLPLHALEPMLEEDPCNPELIRALVKPALSLNQKEAIDRAMARAGPEMVDKDPDFVLYYLTVLDGKVEIYRPVHLLRLAMAMERRGRPEQAIHIYQMLDSAYPTAPDVETALYRMASCYWNSFKDAENARNCLREMARRFPKGQMTPYGRALWSQIPQSEH